MQQKIRISDEQDLASISSISLQPDQARQQLEHQGYTGNIGENAPKNITLEFKGSKHLTSEQKRQLEILGYTKPDSWVRIRCFAAKGMPPAEQLKRGAAWQKDEKTIIPIPIEGWLHQNGTFIRLKKNRCGDDVELDSNGNPIWRKTKTYHNGIGYLRSLNARGYGVYLIPNSGGGADADITRFPALFYECDGISKDEQWQKLRSLEFKLERSASMVVETRNSLHCYFALSYDKLLPSTWTQYQQRLIQQQDSDDGIWNPARLMRFVGFDHQKWNSETRSLEQIPVQLTWESDHTFNLDEFDQILPQWDKQRWSQSQRQGERIATDPVGNPRDIRNFAPYLDSYRANGRRGWDTCKCPAHNGESDNSLHVNQSSGAYTCHAGCAPKDIYHAALELAKSRGYQVPERRDGHRFSELGGWLFKFKQQLARTVERRNIWGFGLRGEVEVESTPAKPAPVIEYQPSEQLRAWCEAVKGGAKYGLVIDPTGCGKNYYAGKTTPESFSAKQVIFVSAEHRNPSTPTLKPWPVLEGRHPGLYKNEFGKLRRADKGEPYIIPPNCDRNKTLKVLRNKNLPSADTAEVICQKTCQHFDQCRLGINFGYLRQRTDTLKQPRLIANPASLPASSEYNYSDKVVIWDEPGQLFKAHRSISVEIADLQQVTAKLTVKQPLALDTLRPLLTVLYSYLSGQQQPPNKYGWKDYQIRAALSELGEVDLEAVAAVLAPDINSLLNPTSKYGVDIADLKNSEKKLFSEKDATVSARIDQELALNWLPDFLSILRGSMTGSLRIENGKLIITVPDQRLAEIARAAKANIFLDATITVEDLARVLDIDPSEILTMRQSLPDTSNLEIIQVATVGRLGVGSTRSDACNAKIEAIIDQIRQDTSGKLAILDFKRHTAKGDGKRHWWVDSRGTNDLEDYSTLVLVGVPCRNLGELEAEFTISHGRPPQEGTEFIKYPIQLKGQPSPDLQPYFEIRESADPEYRLFCRRRILADINQAIGRLRAHRRPNQQLRVYFIGDYPLDTLVTLRKASDITPAAATKTERLLALIKQCFQFMRDRGIKITQSSTARISKELDPNGKGYSQQYLSRCWSLLTSLLEFGSPEASDRPVTPEEMEHAQDTAEVLSGIANQSPQTLVECLCEVFYRWLKPKQWHSVWEEVPDKAQIKILSSLLLMLPTSHLQELMAFSEFG